MQWGLNAETIHYGSFECHILAQKRLLKLEIQPRLERKRWKSMSVMEFEVHLEYKFFNLTALCHYVLCELW